MAGELEAAYPVNRGRGVHVEPLGEVVLGRVRPTLYALLGAVALVLVIACVNVANLLVARGTARAQEIAVRRAIGATPGRVARQFLAEALVLAGCAAVCGVALAYAGVRLLVASAPANVPRLAGTTIDLRVLAVSLGIAVAAGLAFGLLPALQAHGIDLQSTLKQDGARGAVGDARSRLRGALVVGELALAITLLAGAGLLMRSFWNLLSVDPGFRAGGVLKVEYQLPPSRYPTSFATWPNFREQHAFTTAILARAETLPGVDLGGGGRQPSARPRLHEFVRHRRPRDRSARGGMARADSPSRHARLFPDRRSAAATRPPFERRRQHAQRAGSADQRGGGDAILSTPAIRSAPRSASLA